MMRRCYRVPCAFLRHEPNLHDENWRSHAEVVECVSGVTDPEAVDKLVQKAFASACRQEFLKKEAVLIAEN